LTRARRGTARWVLIAGGGRDGEVRDEIVAGLA
jgi:hypothetical protein